MNSVSQLNDALQRREISGLTFTCTRRSGSAHQPIFWYEACATVDGSLLPAISLGFGASKAEAKQAAAGFLLQKLREIAAGLPVDEPAPVRVWGAADSLPRSDTIVFVDLENVQRPELDHYSEAGRSLSVLGYASAGHPMTDPANADRRLTVYSVDSRLADAVDTAIMADVFDRAAAVPDSELVVVSRDHFAQTLADVLRLRHPDVLVRTAHR